MGVKPNINAKKKKEIKKPQNEEEENGQVRLIYIKCECTVWSASSLVFEYDQKLHLWGLSTFTCSHTHTKHTHTHTHTASTHTCTPHTHIHTHTHICLLCYKVCVFFFLLFFRMCSGICQYWPLIEQWWWLLVGRWKNTCLSYLSNLHLFRGRGDERFQIFSHT